MEGDVTDVRLGRPNSQPEPESNVPTFHNAASRSTRSETHAEREAEIATSLDAEMEIESSNRKVRRREEATDPSRHTPDASTDRDPTAEPCGKVPRRAETIERDVDQVNQRAQVDANRRPANASPSEPLSTSAAAASDVSSGERLYVGMTEEGLSGDQRRGSGERTMTMEKAREARRNFYVGESKEHETFSIASAEASPLQGESYLSRRNADEVLWKHLSVEERTQLESIRKTVARSAWFQGGDDHRLCAGGRDQGKTPRPSDLLAACFELEGDRHRVQGQGQMAHRIQDPDIHEFERS